MKGYVADEKGEPMIGVNIRIPGTGTGTTTDLDGNFVLLVPEGTKKLLFTSVGYKDMEVVVKPEMEVKMEVDAQAMEEVVVVGYGKQKKVPILLSVMENRKKYRLPVRFLPLLLRKC